MAPAQAPSIRCSGVLQTGERGMEHPGHLQFSTTSFLCSHTAPALFCFALLSSMHSVQYCAITCEGVRVLRTALNL